MNDEQLRNFCNFFANNFQENRAARQADAERAATRHLTDKLIKQTSLCDGTDAVTTRTWLQDIALAAHRAPVTQLIEIVTSTISGCLRTEVERFIQAYVTREQVVRSDVPWAQLRAHIVQSFLCVDEQGALRDEVEKIRQGPFELAAAYNRRFREAADNAYPADQRNVDQSRILVRSYARGLTSTEMAIKLIEDGNPATLEDAINWVARYSERKDAVSRLGLIANSQEVPMEIGSARPTNPSPSDRPSQEVSALLKKVLNSQEKLSSKIAKIEAANFTRGFHRQDNNYGQFGTDGARKSQLPRALPICYNCGLVGHIQRECPILNRPTRFVAAPDDRSTPTRPHAVPTDDRPPPRKSSRFSRTSAAQPPRVSRPSGNFRPLQH